MEKLVRNGKVAVVTSPWFGAGWSTWGTLDMAFDPAIVLAVENGNMNLAQKIANEKYDVSGIGAEDGLVITWLLQGTKFRIEEYDGSESIVYEKDDRWITA